MNAEGTPNLRPKTPPKRLSTAILTALNDLALVEQDPSYTVNMGVWHEPRFDAKNNPVCHVCFAGSVMAKTCATPMQKFWPDDIREWEHVFNALDSIRMYEVHSAVSDFYRLNDGYASVNYYGEDLIPFALKRRAQRFNEGGDFKNLKGPMYKKNKQKFKEHMLELAYMLKARGL